MKNQVLSISQVQEIIKLGFDISKYASMTYSFKGTLLLGNPSDFKSTEESKTKYPLTPTLTIGDILKILPLTIKDFTPDYTRRIDGNNILYRKNNWECDIILKEFKKYKNLINNLFDCLIWCIKNEEI